MKTLFFFFILALSISNICAQTVIDKVNEKANQRVDARTDQAIDKGLDKAEGAIGSIFKKKKRKAETVDSTFANPDNIIKDTTITATTNQQTAVTEINSFYDFVPGTRVIFSDNFQQDALADFPAKWNTNGSGKIVTIEAIEGKWLDIAQNSIVNPLLDDQLPENCTIEFDLFLQVQGERSIPFIQFGLTPVKDILREDLFYRDKFFVEFNRYNENDGRVLEYGLKEVVGNKSDFPFPAYINKVLHISMAINKARVRFYFDKTKLIDLPRALNPELRNNFYICNMYMIPASELGVLVGNIRITESIPDGRSVLIKQLMEEGKTVTNDIRFDINSAILKPESYNLLNQFGEALKTNPGLKIKIIGHTDSDGEDAANLQLSKNRAEAVKRFLLTNYSIDATRLQADGKGESQPVGDNSTTEGKAKNRRVEFIKL